MTLTADTREALMQFPIELPVFHPVALNLTIMLSDPYSDIDDIINVINEDPALVSQVLKMANSSAYAGMVKSETIKEAVIRLGARQVSMLTMAASQASLHTSDNELINGLMKELWQHSLVCALGCWWVAQHTGHSSIVDHAYLAGLLHDIGKLYLLKALDQLIHSPECGIVLERETVLEIFEEMHVEQGCRIMDHWNIPDIYRSVVADHHQPNFSRIDRLLTMVRLVNGVSRKVNLSLNPIPWQPEELQTEIGVLDLDEAQFAKLESIMYSYRNITV